MKVIKQINNNSAIAIDSSGSQVVVLGSGLGFKKPPYELEDLSKVERTFYELDPHYVELFSSLPKNILLASDDIVEQAELILNSHLNPNLVVTLADHLNFALERMERGINITSPLTYDIQQLYPQEYQVGKIGIGIVEKYTNIRLNDDEAVNIALHFISGEYEKEDIHSIMTSLKVIDECDSIIEKTFEIRIDKNSFAYNRFLSHLRYLMKRMKDGESVDDCNEILLKEISAQYPKVYSCAVEIAKYLEKVYGVSCHKTEILYLTLHINRMLEKTS